MSSLTILGPYCGAGDEDLVATPRAVVDDEPKTVRWEISGVYTAQEARRKGMGTALLAEATRYALQKSELDGTEAVFFLSVTSGNNAARSFYESSGFQFVGEMADGKLRFVKSGSAS